MEKNFNLLIDVKKASYNIVRGLKQGDNNSILNITLTQNSLPFDLTNLVVRVNYKRPDHHIFLQETTITEPKKGQIKINILTQALEFAGEVLADLSIFEGDRKITSVSFSMFVDASVYRNDYLNPEELDIIQKVFQNEVKRNGETSRITEDYLKYKNVMIAESNVAALQNNIDKITSGIGGRNLVVDSLNLKKYFATNAEFAGTVTILSDVYPVSAKCTKVECTKSGTGGLFHFPFFQKTATKVGKTYTWSCYVLSNIPKNMLIGHECGGKKDVVISNVWRKITHTWRFTDEQFSSFVFYAKDGWNVGDTIYIADMKIEEGTVPSTWTPAPEDMAEKSHTHLETDITSGFGQVALPTGYRKLPGGLIWQWGSVTPQDTHISETQGSPKLYIVSETVKLPVTYSQFFKVFASSKDSQVWATGTTNGDKLNEITVTNTTTEGRFVVTRRDIEWHTIGY